MIYNIKKNMSLLTIFTIFFVFTLSFTVNVKAHSPSDMKINYNNNTDIIDATITHQVSNPEVHYINKIEVRINNELYTTFDYTGQPGSTFTYKLEEINANVSDIIEVKALCNQGGDITVQLTVSEKNGESTGESDSTPGFEILVFIVASVLVLVILRNISKNNKK